MKIVRAKIWRRFSKRIISDPLVRQLALFLTIGLLLLGSDLLLFLCLLWLGLTTAQASFLAFLTMGVVGYWSHLRVTFRQNRPERSLKLLLLFLAVNLAFAALMHYVFVFLVAFLESGTVIALLLRTGVIGAGAFFRFLIYRRYIFGKVLLNPQKMTGDE
jgi:putative flippase GtrA